MEYREIEFTVVQTIRNHWRWSVKRHQHNDKVGKTFSRDSAIIQAKRFIDGMIKTRLKLEGP